MQPPVTAANAALYDIADAQAFVGAAVSKLTERYHVSLDERREWVAEGVVVLYGLAGRYEHHRDGYERPGSFAGYAASLIDGRLIDAWHRMKGHRYVKRDGGGRGWADGPRVESLDELAGVRGDGATPASRDDEPATESFEDRLRGALRDDFEARMALHVQVAVMRSDGLDPRAIADELGMSVGDVRESERKLVRALERLA